MNLLKHECDFFWLYQEEDKEDDDFEQPRTFKTRKGGSSQPANQVWLKEKGVWLREEGVWLREKGVWLKDDGLGDGGRQSSKAREALSRRASTQDDTGGRSERRRR